VYRWDRDSEIFSDYVRNVFFLNTMPIEIVLPTQVEFFISGHGKTMEEKVACNIPMPY
jgi:hypothetical protein